MAGRRQYPHVGGVADWQAAQSLRLLWDRYYELNDQRVEDEGTIEAQAAEITTLQSRLSTAERKITTLQLSQAKAVATDPDAGLDTADAIAVSGPFATGPTAINFPGLGIVQVYSSPDVSGWPETGTITRLGFDPALLTVNYSTMAAWLPGVNIGGGTFQEATLWLFFNIGGPWYGAGAERFRPNQTTKAEATLYSQWPRDFWYDATRWGPLASLTPFAGQPAAALMTSGSTRVDNTTIVQERTSLLLFSWPADGLSISFP